MEKPPGGFWSSLPGVFTGLAAVLTAGTGLYIAVSRDAARDTTGAPQSLGAIAPAPPAERDVDRSAVGASSAGSRALVPDAALPDGYPRQAIALDPDGFVYVRAGPGRDHAVIAKVLVGQRFAVAPRPERPWWPVRTPDGREGFMHRSRIKLADG